MLLENSTSVCSINRRGDELLSQRLFIIGLLVRSGRDSINSDLLLVFRRRES